MYVKCDVPDYVFVRKLSYFPHKQMDEIIAVDLKEADMFPWQTAVLMSPFPDSTTELSLVHVFAPIVWLVIMLLFS